MNYAERYQELIDGSSWYDQLIDPTVRLVRDTFERRPETRWLDLSSGTGIIAQRSGVDSGTMLGLFSEDAGCVSGHPWRWL